MASPRLQSALQPLLGALEKVDARTERESLRPLREQAARAAEIIRAEAGAEAGDAAAQLVAVLDALLARQVSAAVAAPVLQLLRRTLKGAGSPAGMNHADRKQAQAQANLLLRDIARVAAQDDGDLDDDDQRELVIEIEKRLDELEQTLFGLQPGEADPEVVRGVFREFHTLKGESAIIGLKAVAEFYHSIETEIESARSGQLVLVEDLLDVLRELLGVARRLLQGESREEIGVGMIDTLLAALREASREGQEAAKDPNFVRAPAGAGGSGGAGGGTEAGAASGADNFDDFFDNVALPTPDAAGSGDAEADSDAAERLAAIADAEVDEDEAAADAAALAFLLGDSPASPDGGAAGSAIVETTTPLPGTEEGSADAPAAAPDAFWPSDGIAPPPDDPDATHPAPLGGFSPDDGAPAAKAGETRPAPMRSFDADVPIPGGVGPGPGAGPGSACGAPRGDTTDVSAGIAGVLPDVSGGPGDSTLAMLSDTERLALAADTDYIPGAVFSIKNDGEASSTEAMSDQPTPRRRASDRRSPRGDERRAEETTLRAIPIDVERIDLLIELVTEMALNGVHVFQHPLVSTDPDLHDRAGQLVGAGRRLQEVAATLRMTPIRPLFNTIRRAALDAARASGKLVNVKLEGDDTQVDRSVIEQLSAALVHIVRNAVDHGVEPAEVRRSRGKPERGQVLIRASRLGNDVLIELSDDGGGLNLESIRKKAENMGIIAPDATLSESETTNLIFHPGLSTSGRVTKLSGRGVGMEIVARAMADLNGRVDVSTALGGGTVFKMRFPVALAALEGMLVRVGVNTLVLPAHVIRECFRVNADQVSHIQGRGTVVTIRGVVVPVLFPEAEFGFRADAQRPEDGVLALVEDGDLLCAVLVDETLEARQVVIRPLEGPLKGHGLVTGAALLPDRSVALVVDARRLLERVGIEASSAFMEASQKQAAEERKIDTVSIGSNQVGVIDFSVAGPDGRGGTFKHVFAINAFKTKEFVEARNLQPLPGAPAGFSGILMLRGEAVPTVHPGVLLGLISESERRPEWERLVLLCEFAGRTVGFVVSEVNRVSYISWNDIMPPPDTGGLFSMDYVVGSILMARLGHTMRGHLAEAEGAGAGAAGGAARQELADGEAAAGDVAFVLDFERIVGNVIALYGDMGAELGGVDGLRKAGARIMLVEDSPLIRKQTTKALEKAGIEVIACCDGQEAWDKIGEIWDEAEKKGVNIFNYVDLIMSDIEMPRMDGYTLTYNLKHHPQLRVLPVLLHSSITSESMVRRAREVEADGFIPKCDPKELAAQLRKYI